MSRDGRDDEYRLHAKICLDLAQKTDDPESKAALVDMAHSWHNLAQQHDKSSRSETLVYETPPAVDKKA
jgi:hypothetical protein